MACKKSYQAVMGGWIARGSTHICQLGYSDIDFFFNGAFLKKFDMGTIKR